MSLTDALNSATSSLRAISTQLAVSANNIANADDTSYTKKIASTSATLTGSTVTGVEVTSISSNVDANLVKSIIKATSAAATDSTIEDYLQNLSDSLGTLSSDSSGDTLTTYLSSLESALEELATSPESDSLKTEVVSDLEVVLSSLNSSSDTVQTMRADADSDIEAAVDTVNDALYAIDELNETIAQTQAQGESTADLEDERLELLESIAEQMDVNYYVDSSGQMNIYTTTGVTLLSDSVHELSYTAATAVTSSTTFSDITVDGLSISGDITEGNIAGLVQLRDETLVNVQSQLDTLATSLKTALNDISNQGSASPPPNSLTGTETYDSTDALSASGTLTVAVTDSDGNVVSTTDLTLSSYSTVGDLVTALDGISGLSASLDSSGHLVVSADDSTQGVVVSGGTIGTENFSGYFGLNDVVTGTSASSIAVKSSLSTDPTLLSVATIATTLTVGESAVSDGTGDLASSMIDALDDAGISDGASEIVSNVATLLSSAETEATSSETTLTTLTDTFSSNYGVNTDEESATITELQNSYAAAAQVLSTVQSMFDALLDAVS